MPITWDVDAIWTVWGWGGGDGVFKIVNIMIVCKYYDTLIKSECMFVSCIFEGIKNKID